MLGPITDTAISNLATAIASLPIDRSSLPQHRLNLDHRKRTSVFSWRGQFSPELVDLLLSEHSNERSVVLDPFVGGGTTLFEAARHHLLSYGAEINPAALQLASIAQLSALSGDQRRKLLGEAELSIEYHLGGYLPTDLFHWVDSRPSASDLVSSVKQMLHDANQSELFDLLAATVMLAIGDGTELEGEALQRSFRFVSKALLTLPFSPIPCQVLAADARQLPLADQSIDLVITSPPYINVFNYHQNYRKAMELMGWDVLKVARSEIGANRKHRSNRFLTLIQYCLDMQQALQEMRRTLKPKGKAIVVIGRESKVQGLSFRNGQILAILASGGAGFQLTNWQERCFTNRFGIGISEDLLTLMPNAEVQVKSDDFARQVAVWMLARAMPDASPSAKAGVEAAIKEATLVQPSPLFSFTQARSRQ